MGSSYEQVIGYINLIRDKKYLFIILSLCFMSVIVWGSYFIPTKYKAKSTIFIEKNVIEKLIQGIAITPSMQSRVNVLRNTMLSRSLVLNVLRKLDMDSRAENAKALEEMIVRFQKKTDIRIKNNSLVTVSYVNKTPLLARDYVNSLINEYVEKNIFAKREEAYGATRFLSDQVAFFKQKMDKKEEEIIKFRQKQGIYIAMNERSTISEIKKYTTNLEAIKIKNNELNATISSIRKQLDNEEPFTVTMYSGKGAEDTIRSLENRLKQLLVTYTENYPEVMRVKAEIEALKNENSYQSLDNAGSQKESVISAMNPVYQKLKQRTIDLQAEIKALHAKEVYINHLIRKKKEELKNIPESRKKLADLEKERNSYKDIYQKLLIRFGQSEVSKQMEIENKATTFRIIEPAILPTIPVSPNRKMLIFAGIIFGFLGGFGVIFLLDSMDHSIKNLETLKSLQLPILAIIPRMQSSEEILRERKKEIMLFSFAGLYVLCIVGVLIMEFLGLTYVGDFINDIFNKQYL